MHNQKVQGGGYFFFGLLFRFYTVEPEISNKRKSMENEEETSEKKVKTSSGTFSVSDK